MFHRVVDSIQQWPYLYSSTYTCTRGTGTDSCNTGWHCSTVAVNVTGTMAKHGVGCLIGYWRVGAYLAQVCFERHLVEGKARQGHFKAPVDAHFDRR